MVTRCFRFYVRRDLKLHSWLHNFLCLLFTGVDVVCGTYSVLHLVEFRMVGCIESFVLPVQSQLWFHRRTDAS